MDVLTLRAILTLDKSAYDRGLTEAGANADKYGSKFRSGMTKVAKAGAIALGAFAVSSVKVGADFDKSMSQVAATMGYTVDELHKDGSQAQKDYEALENAAREMGKQTKFSAQESAEALNYMALAGYDVETSISMLPKVLSLAAAGNMDLARASDMVTDSQSALGLSIEETEHMIDQMAKTSSLTNTNVEQLGEAYLTVGGTAKMMKSETESAEHATAEMSAALGVLASAGIKGSEGGTALRNVLQGITKGKFEKTFGALGVSAYDAKGELRDLPDILYDMNNAMDGMTTAEKTDIIQKTFNVRDLKSVNALLAETPEHWDELTEAIMDSEGAAQNMADVQLDNLAGDVTILKSAFSELMISVSDLDGGALRKLVQGLTWVINNMNIIGPIVLGAATAFGVFAVAINIGSIISKTTAAMAAFNAVLLANPIGIVVALIAGLVVAIVALWKNNEEFRNKVTAIWNAIKSVAKTAFEAIKKYIVEPIKKAYSDAIAKFNELKAKASSVFNSIKSTASSIWNGIKNAITNPIKTAKETVKGIINKIKGLFPFSIKKVFNLPRLPKISITTAHKKVGLVNIPYPVLSWHAKAMQNPYLFSGATLFGAGEAGDEVLYGRTALMRDIKKAVGESTTNNNNITFNIYSQPNQSPREIAESVRKIIIQEENRKRLAWT